MELSLFDQLEELLLVSIPTAKGGETAQQDVEDDTQSPHVHFNAITCRDQQQHSRVFACMHVRACVCFSMIFFFFFYSFHSGRMHRPVSQRISGATYVGVPHIVKTGSVTTIARPKSPSFSLQTPAAWRSI